MKKKTIIFKRLTLAFVLVSLLTLMTGISFGADVDVYLRADVLTIPMNTFDNSDPIVMWGYAQCTDNSFNVCTDATVPGPTIRAKAGDVLTIHLKNNLTGAYTEPTSIVIPGQVAAMVPTWTDGTTGNRTSLTQRVRSFTNEASVSGGPVTYVWDGSTTAPGLKAGTYLYESGTHPSLQVQMGLYGALIVDTNPAVSPKVAYPGVTYNSEAIVLYSEIDPALHNAVASGQYGPHTLPLPSGWMTSTIDYNPKFFLVNGRPYTPGSSPVLTGTPGDTTIIRYLNAGLQTHVPIVHGFYQSIRAEDGNLLPYPREQYSIMLAAGKTMDAIITLPATPGYIPIYDRTLDLTNGASAPGGLLAYIDAGSTHYTLNVNKNGSTGTGTIIAESMPGGISCGADCQETYNSGTVMRLSAIPDAGSSFAGWSGDPSCTGIGTCIVTMNGSKTITGVFTPIVHHTVTPSVGSGNGTITPSAPQSVADGNTESFTLNPSAHYHISSVGGTCGGTLVGNQYTTASITGDCSVIANFAIDQFTVTPSAGANGSITPPGPQTVDYNNSPQFTVSANTGYHIASVTGCGGTFDTNTGIYTTGPVTANCSVTASFAINQYLVTPSAGPNGGISPSTQQTVNYNTTAVFTVTPNPGFGIASVTGCGGTLNVNTNQYTTGAITADCPVNATFAPLPPISVVSPNGGENWAAGSTHTITWTYTGNLGSLVKIELLKGGGLISTIRASTFIGNGGNGSYNWNIPGNLVTGGDYQVRVTSITNAAYTDTSNANFTITGPPPPSITVTTPNGGENWAAGSAHTITWTYTGNLGSLVKIELLKGGGLISAITSSTSAGNGGNGSYNWNIPGNLVTGGDYQIRVTSTTDAAYTDTSNANFTITGPPPPSITVTTPNGGENWAAGSAHTITWTYTGNLGSLVKIELLKGGGLISVITSSTSAGSGGNGSYNWNIPGNLVTGADYTIRITSTTNAAYTDTSNANFTITGPPPPSITVTTPNGGESWAAGSTQTIRWTYTGNLGSLVKIELLKGGGPISTIRASTFIGNGGNGSYNWNIPSNLATGGDYQIRVTSITNAAYTDMSNANFTIQ